MTVLSPLFHVTFVPLLLHSRVSCLVSPEHPSHRVTRGSCAGICEETNAYGSVLVVTLTAGSGRGLCRVSRLTNPGGHLGADSFAGAVGARQRWGHLKEKLYPKNGTCFPRKHHGETPTTLSGFQAGWYPDLPHWKVWKTWGHNADSISWRPVDCSGCWGSVPTAHGGWKTLGICGREQESGHTVTGEGLCIPSWDAVTCTWQRWRGKVPVASSVLCSLVSCGDGR